MFAGALEAGSEAKKLGIVAQSLGVAYEARLAFGERAGFVDDEGVDFFQDLQSLGVLDEHASACAAAYADHNCHWRGKAQGAWAGDDEDRDRIHQGVREARLRTEEEPREESDNRGCDHGGHEPFGHAVGEALDGSTAALGLADELHDARQQGFAADALGFHDEGAGAVDGGTDDFAVRGFFDRHGFAGDHGLVNRTAAFEQDAIDGDFFSGTHAQTVAGLYLLKRNIFLGTIGVEQARGAGAEIEEGANGGAGAAAGAQFHDLAEQDESGDGGGGFEVDVGIAAHGAQRLGKNPGRKRGDDAVSIGDAGAHADQGEHVRAAIDERSPEALEERQAAPEDDGSGQDEVRARAESAPRSDPYYVNFEC